MVKKSLGLPGVLLAAFAGTAAFADVVAATSDSGAQAVVQEQQTRKQLLAFHEILQKNLKKKAYSHLEDSDRERIAVSQSRLRAILADVDAIEKLSEADRLELWNEHARVLAILEAREDQRLVCERVFKTGTHVAKTECMTVAERDRIRQEAADMMREQKVIVDTPSAN